MIRLATRARKLSPVRVRHPVKGDEVMETPRNILAPTDFSEMSNGSAAYAAKLAIAMNARLHLHHVVHESETAHPLRALDDAEKEEKEKLAAILTAEEKERLNLTSYVGFGPPANQIVEHAEKNDIDLIVMGTHGRSGLEKMWLGSVTEKVLRQAHCPVLVVRQS